MLERKAITEDVFNAQINVNDGLHPQQPTFFHAWNESTESKLIEKYGAIPEFVREDEKQKQWRDYQSAFDISLLEDGEPQSSEKYDLTLLEEAGTMWILAGQVPSEDETGKPTVKYLPLPLKSGNGQKFLVEFPIESGSRNFEIGHTTTRARGALYSMLAHAAQLMYFDVRATNGDPKKSYVNAHALDRAHAIIYNRLYRMPFMPSNLPSPESAFRKPLLDFIKDHPPSRYIKAIKQILHMAKGRFSEIDALDFYYDLKDLGQRFLSLNNPQYKSKDSISIRDFSDLRERLGIIKFQKQRIVRNNNSGLYPLSNEIGTPYSELDRLREQKVNGSNLYSPFD